jgi:hypothetical protein
VPEGGLQNWAIRNNDPNRPAYMKKLTALAAAKPGRRNSDSGSIGAGARRSQPMNAPTSAAPAVSEPSTSALVQPARPSE